MGNTPGANTADEDLTREAVRVMEIFGPRYFRAFKWAVIQNHIVTKAQQHRRESSMRAAAPPRPAGASSLPSSVGPAVVVADGAGSGSGSGGGDSGGGGLDVGAVAVAQETSVEALAAPRVPKALMRRLGFEPTRELEEAPEDDHPVFEGWLEKRGEVHTGFKRRFFVVGAQDVGYEIPYYEKMEHKEIPGKHKGVMRLCGYSVKRMKSDEEVKEYGKLCLALRPNNPWSRTWILRCSSEEERVRWKEILKFVAQHTPPPLNRDPVMRQAFTDAYLYTRTLLRMDNFTGFSHGEEDELLALAFAAAENSGIVRFRTRGWQTSRPDTEDVEEGGVERDETFSDDDEAGAQDIDDVALAALKDAVGQRWRRLVASAAQSRRMVKKSMAKVSVEADKVVGSIMKYIRSPIEAVMHTDIEDMVSPILVPLTGALLGPVFGSMEVSVSCICKSLRSWAGLSRGAMSAVRSRSRKRIAVDLERIAEFARSSRWFSGPLIDAYQHVRNLSRNEEGSVNIAASVDAIALLAASEDSESKKEGLDSKLTPSKVPESIIRQAQTAGTIFRDRRVGICEFLDMLQGMTLYEIELRLERTVWSFVQDAMHSLANELKMRMDDKDSIAPQQLAEVILDFVDRLEYSAVRTALSNMRKLLVEVILPPLEEEAQAKTFSIMEEAQHLIPAHLSPILDTDMLRRRVLTDCILVEIDSLLQIVCEPATVHLKTMSAELRGLAEELMPTP